MTKLLIMAMVFWVAYGYLRRHQKRRNTATQVNAKPTEEPMVRCVKCGVYIPRANAVIDAEQCFCSEAHQKAYQNQHD